jgi:hypothetical protein
MAKKCLLVLVLASALAGGIFAQETSEDAHKHQPFDMLLSFNVGIGITPNMGDLFSVSGSGLPSGNYALTTDLGVVYDFYLFHWLSFNTGLLAHPDMYLILDQKLEEVKSFTDIVAYPLCLTIPFAAHINVPGLEWLYAGIGLNLNIPLFGLLDSTVAGIDTKGDFFIGLPIDIGFDLIKASSGGKRFFFRITPEFHEKGVAIPIGIVWQANSWKIYSK